MRWTPPPLTSASRSFLSGPTFRRARSAIKLHTLLTLQDNFFTVIIVYTGSVHDVNILDFARWYRIHQRGVFFITRAKQNFRCALRYSRLVDKTNGLRFDQTVVMTGLNA